MEFVLREALARLGGGDRYLERGIHTKTTVCPVKRVCGQPLADEGALKKESDNDGAEVLTELNQVEGWYMDKPSVTVEAAFRENFMEMGIPSRELARRRRGDHSGASHATMPPAAAPSLQAYDPHEYVWGRCEPPRLTSPPSETPPLVLMVGERPGSQPPQPVQPQAPRPRQSPHPNPRRCA